MDREITAFLIKAKQATYAGKGAETNSSREKSHDLIYRDGDYMYYDTYLGTGKFAGEEAIWIKNNPFWSMNYIGRVTGDHFSGDFLKEALLHVPEDKPFRGPESYSNGDYTYHCDVNTLLFPLNLLILFTAQKKVSCVNSSASSWLHVLLSRNV